MKTGDTFEVRLKFKLTRLENFGDEGTYRYTFELDESAELEPSWLPEYGAPPIVAIDLGRELADDPDLTSEEVDKTVRALAAEATKVDVLEYLAIGIKNA